MIPLTDTPGLSTYIANEEALDALKAEVDANSDSAIPQPVIIIGPEGSGKTTLLQRLNQAYVGPGCVWIDGRSVFSSADIMDRCAKNQVSIVMVDDMDYFLSRCSYDEQFRLRRYLYNEGAPMLIASASKVHQALVDYNAPFFDGLKKIYLAPISKDIIVSLFGDDSVRALAMFELLYPTVKTAVLIGQIIQQNSNAVQDIPLLISIFSDKFKSIYSELPTYSQQIVNALASGKDGMRMADIKERSGLPPNILSAYLQNLEKHGIIAADKSLKKNRQYHIKDPLFKLWLNYPTGI